jgi:nucleoside-diphosphate-sugar epimerase
MPRASPSSSLFVFGLGYSARFLASVLAAEAWTIAGTGRSEATCSALASAGFDAHLFDREHPLDAAGRAALAASRNVLVTIPPDASGDPTLDRHGADLALRNDLRWLGYLSTTGVYGDRAGGWVDEDSELRPVGERGARRVAAERGWLDLWRQHGLPVHVFRLAGIYGPGRNALDAVRRSEARRIVKAGQVFSRIHVADIARVLRASLARPRSGAVYNVCDDEPAPPQDVIRYACELLGTALPAETPFESAANSMSAMGRSFFAESKRVANRRIKQELGVRLAFPSYREGLRALVDEPAQPPSRD